MSSCRFRAASLALCLGCAPARAQLPAAWFGSGACASLPEIVVAEHEVLLHVRLHEADPGADEILRVRPGGELVADAATLKRWGVEPATDWQALRDVPGLRFRYDKCSQELLLDLRGVARARHRARVADTLHEPVPASVPGGFANADVQLNRVDGDSDVSALIELGGFHGRAHGTFDFVARDEDFVRLDARWVLDDPTRLRRLSVGDAIARPAAGRRALRFGGFSWGTEWALQPDLIRHPLPGVRGDAALPSTVEVYVDNVLRSRQDVPAGPFEIDRLPTLSGAGVMQVVVRDALGRSEVATQPYYAAPELLRPGLEEYAVDAGWLREQYGTESDAYGAGFVAGAWRRGLTDRLSVGAQADVGAGRAGLGGEFTVLAPALGLFSASLAASSDAPGTGAQLGLSLSRQSSGYSAALALECAARDYRGLGESRDAPRMLLRAHGGLPALGGSLALNLLVQERADRSRVRIESLGWTRRLGAHWGLSAQLARVHGDGQGWNGAVGLARNFGGGNSASAELEHRADGHAARAGWQHDPAGVLGVGWRVGVEEGPLDRAAGQVRWSGTRGRVQAEADLRRDGSAARVGAQTGVAVLGGQAFWTRPVEGSFAVVQAGAPGVRVLRDQQWAATTNDRGLALIPDLRAYESNPIGLDLADLPLDLRVDQVRHELVPYARSALALDFGVRAEIPRRLRVRLDDGAPLPSGAALTLEAPGASALAGVGGLVLVEHLEGAARLEARWSGGGCVAQLPAQAAAIEEAVTCARTP